MESRKEKEWIVIRGAGSVSGLGGILEEVRHSMVTGKNCFSYLPSLGSDTPVAPLSSAAETLLQELLLETPAYASVDRSVQLAILAARQAVAQAGWSTDEEAIGINIGSSRGATGLFEQYYREFLEQPEQRLSPSASPSTTLGNIASWVANDLGASGPLISHSVTCSTALQAFANGVAWLKAGMAKRFLVGGSEAPLTPFTLAQMKGVGIYSKLAAQDTPCRPFNQQGLNTFVLGEGAAIFALERMTLTELRGLDLHEAVVVEAVGLGFERSPSKTGITKDGQHFQEAMKDALAHSSITPSGIDAIVAHAPGTRAGDAAEMAALETVFENKLPPLFSNKWLLGHTLGASGALSAITALHLLSSPSSASPEYASALVGNEVPASMRTIMINAAGFGGNAASLLIRKILA
ncbi:beta-ketoacyl synthase N-terminal-like domain-containing protein [Rufibacter immobilis]|uniref:beta-ketoacyl synthase N-terminal-like domain-containing protein n=1 Tax=Rufibacter immobilis TaxID=1348778 RepID=UPI0035E669DB